MKNRIKGLGRLLKWILGSAYDFFRFACYGGWQINLHNKEQRNYYAAKVYHSLEKSLSFSERKPDSGWGNAEILVTILETAIKAKNIGYHDQLGLAVLNKFVSENFLNTSLSIADNVKNRLAIVNSSWPLDTINNAIGTIELDSKYIFLGKLKEPINFFGTRYSIREFSETRINKEDLIEAVELSLKTPSACNRQPWHVYSITEKDKIDLALSYQSGNKGFTHEIRSLLIICSDIRAFNPGSERYQHWIDGGMYAMSLIYALHSKGIASCCLNWSHQGSPDKAFRSVFSEICSSHTIIMMLAIGIPKDINTVCVSPRRPLNEVYSEI